MTISVGVLGARGRMGGEVCRAVEAADDMTLVAGVDEVVELMVREWERLADSPITPAELERSIGQLSGGLVLGLEDTGSRMSRLGKSELVYGELMTVDEILSSIDAVQLDDVQDVAADLLRASVALAVIGPYDDDHALRVAVA